MRHHLLDVWPKLWVGRDARELRLLREQVEDPDLLPAILDVQPDLLPLNLIGAPVLDLRVGLDPARAERLLRPPREVSSDSRVAVGARTNSSSCALIVCTCSGGSASSMTW